MQVGKENKMKKQLLAVLVAVMAFGMVSVSALNADIQLPLSGNGYLGEIHYPITDDIDLVTGINLSVPLHDGEGLSTWIGGGLSLPIPVIGRHVITASASKSAVKDSEFELGNLDVTKTWLYDLSQGLQIGVQLNVLSVQLKGDKTISLLSSVGPVLRANIDLF